MSCGHSHHQSPLGSNTVVQTLRTAMGGSNTPSAGAASSSYPQLNFTPKGAQIRSIYQDRIKGFDAGGQYAGVNLRSMYDFDREAGKEFVKLEVWHAEGMKRPTFDEAMKGTYEPTEKGQSFGPSWSTHWFKITLKVPERMKDYPRLELQWDANNEGLVWTPDGEPLQGLTGGGERTEWVLPEAWRDGKEHLFYIEMACNGMFGNPEGDTIQPPNPNRYFQLSKADIVAPNLEAIGLHMDIWIIGDAAREFPENSWESRRATQVCNRIIEAFVPGSQDSILEGRKIAQEYLGDKVDSADVYKAGTEPIVYGIGHCHIDTAWLWPFDETKRKVARSWSNQCGLIDRYPEHRFTASSAQQYKWLEQLYPKLFDRVRQKVLDGKFQYIGGSWVEHDTNMPSGESLTRQFLLGQRYFQSRFGQRCTTFWLPDTFGYSSQLPQLCRLAGMTRFFTQKLSWNNINDFPHSTFNWISLDGSQVLCHMPPSETYTADAHFGDVMRSVTQHKSMDNNPTSLLVFGKGDGGGGPTVEHLEKLRRCRGMSNTIGRLPSVHMGTSVDEFFDELEKQELSGDKFVTWYGELYLEFHRGTYTTQSNNKKNNRRAEIMMKDLEMMATSATMQAPDKYKYPKQEIDDMWEVMCLCQFHDCLPGSCIEMVYRDTDGMYADLFKKGEKLFKEACDALDIQLEASPDSKAYALNTLPWPRTALVEVPKDSMATLQDVAEKPDKGLAFVAAEGLGMASQSDSLTAHPPKVSAKEIAPDVFTLENEVLKATFQKGVMTSCVYLEDERELIPKGSKANQLVIFDDKPLYWQAWDVEMFHFASRKELSPNSVSILESGPLKATLLVETKISEASWIKTHISLEAATAGTGAMITFHSDLEWHETMKFLKVEFPVDIHNTSASYETQYGVVSRPTHYNTTWDMAKFEVCSHKFADLSEHGFGVSILNDCKYGFATAGNLMRLSLMRAPKAPDAHADMGHHQFRYAFFPHKGALDVATVRAAAEFNNPMQAAFTPRASAQKAQDALAGVASMTGGESIVLDTIKRGEDDEDVSTGGLPVNKGKSVVLRFYESLGGRATTTLHSKLPVKKVLKVNLLEDEIEEVPSEKTKDGATVAKITLRPFEVATFKLQL